MKPLVVRNVNETREYQTELQTSLIYFSLLRKIAGKLSIIDRNNFLSVIKDSKIERQCLSKRQQIMSIKNLI